MKILIRIICLLCLFSSNCSLIYPTKNPIDTIYYITGKEKSENLIVMLPGRGDRAGDYMKNGFIKAVKDSGINADVIEVDAHSGYYYERNLIPRLYEGVILSAMRKGYRNIWLMGISVGGLGTLLYSLEHYDTLKGIIVIAPFLGDKEIIEEISAAGGLSRWNPREPIDKEDYQRMLWAWLKGFENSKENLPCLILGYGKDDRFAPANSLLANILPNNQVYAVPGDHDWDTWTRLFHLFLKSGIINKK